MKYDSDKKFVNPAKEIDYLREVAKSQQNEIWKLQKSLKILNVRERNFNRLAIFTVHTPPYYPEWPEIAIKNKYEYVQKHGYGISIEHGKSDLRHPVWSKIASLVKFMEESSHEWFWALDLDTLIMNTNIKAHEILDDKYDLIVNRDCNWFNAGSFMIKNTKWSRNYLRQGIVTDVVLNVTDPKPEFFLEQAAMMNVVEANPGYEKHFKWVPQETLHSYLAFPSAICDVKLKPQYPEYQPGHFVLHFPRHSSAEWFPAYLKDWYSRVDEVAATK
jgi:mannan polymerase II complex MNN10 subunit